MEIIKRGSLCLSIGLLLNMELFAPEVKIPPMEEFLNMIATVESGSGTNLIQDTIRGDDTGPGTGHFQWEVHGDASGDFKDTSGAAWNIISRAHFQNTEKSPDWLVDLVNKVSSVPVPGQGRVGNVKRSDVMNLTEEQQYFIQERSIRGSKEQLALFNKFSNAKSESDKVDIAAEWWLDYHWKGAKKGTTEYDDKKEDFKKNFGNTNKIFNFIQQAGETLKGIF